MLRAACRLPHPPPVVIVTGREEGHILAELRAAGASCCLRKPVMLPDLLALVRELAGLECE